VQFSAEKKNCESDFYFVEGTLGAIILKQKQFPAESATHCDSCERVQNTLLMLAENVKFFI
jgi:hypothetical protein